MYFKNAKIWVFGEHTNGMLSNISYQLLGIASKLAEKIHSNVLIILNGSNEITNHECIKFGADYVVNASFRGKNDTEFLVDLAEKMCLIEEPDIILCGSTEWGINFAPRLAVRLCAGLTAHCINLEICNETGRLLQTRPTSFNNLFATIMSTSKIQMATIKPNFFQSNNGDNSRKGQVIDYTPLVVKNDFEIKRVVRFIEEQESNDDKIVIGVGNGIIDYPVFSLVESFANTIHAPIYGTREAVAKGMIGLDRQIGITGKMINPKLYIAIGISGAYNHLLGISKTTKILAVNTDVEAEMVKLADYKIIADAKDFLDSVLQNLLFS